MDLDGGKFIMEKKFYNLTNPQKNIWNMEQYYKGTADEPGLSAVPVGEASLKQSRVSSH